MENTDEEMMIDPAVVIVVLSFPFAVYGFVKKGLDDYHKKHPSDKQGSSHVAATVSAIVLTALLVFAMLHAKR